MTEAQFQRSVIELAQLNGWKVLRPGRDKLRQKCPSGAGNTPGRGDLQGRSRMKSTKRTYSFGSPYERALRHVAVAGNGCWVWQGATVPAGYGNINCGGGKYRLAHIVTYEHKHGPVPAGLELDHLCRNPACVNPDHLEAVTHAENVRRGTAGQRRCSHPENELYRRKGVGHIVQCRACRRERRRREAAR